MKKIFVIILLCLSCLTACKGTYNIDVNHPFVLVSEAYKNGNIIQCTMYNKESKLTYVYKYYYKDSNESFDRMEIYIYDIEGNLVNNGESYEWE